MPFPNSVRELQFFLPTAIRIEAAADRNAMPLLFFTELDNLHVLLDNLLGYASFH